MSGRIKGITVEIDGNTTNLQKSLSEVDGKLKNTQKSLKDVEKLLKFDPKNVELLNQKHQLLSKSVTDTKDKLAQLKKAQEQMDAKNVDKNSEQYQALQREIIATEQDLNKAQKALDSFEKEMAESAETTKKAGISLEEFGAGAKKVSDNTRALSAGAAALGTAFVGMAYNAGKSADDLLTLSRNTGFSVEELQKMQYASDLVDVSMDQMTGSVEKLTKQMSSGSDAFDTLGVSITDGNGNMRDAVDVWYETLEALSKVENETERDQIAMQLFGKSAMDLSGIVDDGGEALKNLGQEAEDMGLILSEDAVGAAGEFNDAIDKLKAQTSQAFFEAGAALAESLIPMLQELAETVTGVIQWFSDLDGNTQMLIITILGLVAAISPIAGLISGICTIGGVLAGITAPMAVTFMGIAAAVGVVIAIGTVLVQNWDNIINAGKNLFSTVSNVWNSILNTISSVVSSISSIVSNVFNNVRNTISNAINGAKDAVSNAIQAIKNLFNFQISWPHIPLPHFSVSGSANPLDWIKNGVPKISIDWYAKAQNMPYLFNTPTIIGVGDVPEVVVGADTFRRMVSTYNTPVTVNVYGNVNDYDALARTISDRINRDMQRKMRIY